MQSQIKDYCGTLLEDTIYKSTYHNAPEHFRLVLPSILSPQTSYPLVSLNRSMPGNYLPNWSFLLAIKCKLRIPVFNITDPPTCKCGTQHDIWGGHTFNCIHHSKIMAHHFIRESWATAIQPALTFSGYISNSTKLDIERPNITTTEISARPFDISFEPSLHATNTNFNPCPFSIVDTDVNITHSHAHFTPLLSADVKQQLTVIVDQHLQLAEKKKFTHGKVHINPDTDSQQTIPGNTVMKDLLDKNTILIPFALDPQGHWGPITPAFLPTPTTSTLT
jgi:hypothetical protein